MVISTVAVLSVSGHSDHDVLVNKCSATPALTVVPRTTTVHPDHLVVQVQAVVIFALQQYTGSRE